jgi:hypothetical protein
MTCRAGLKASGSGKKIFDQSFTERRRPGLELTSCRRIRPAVHNVLF